MIITAAVPQGVRDSVGSAPPVKAAEQTTGLDTMGDVKMEKARRQEMVALRDADEQMADVVGVVFARGRETPRGNERHNMKRLPCSEVNAPANQHRASRQSLWTYPCIDRTRTSTIYGRCRGSQRGLLDRIGPTPPSTA